MASQYARPVLSPQEFSRRICSTGPTRDLVPPKGTAEGMMFPEESSHPRAGSRSERKEMVADV